MHVPSYYENARTELLDLLPRPPQRLLDIGCAAGATSAEAKRRWPSVTTIGIEVVEEVAAQAVGRLDRVIAGSAEALDLGAEGIAGVDAVLLGDVLEHMIDPWSFLARLRPIVAPGGCIAASIPNVSNFWLIEELAAGRFDYADEGLLDRTHLRFFTRSTIEKMFGAAGYHIEHISRITDGRVDDALRHRFLGILLPQRLFGRVNGRNVRLSGISPERFDDLRTIQFTLLATAV
jgi:2-polyprenyl-3-methyl-5-hydroxy-6-metoxy-1,4-benzoquinol methylase